MPRIRLSKSIVGEEEAAAVRDVLQSDGYLGMGAYVMKFEEELADYLDVPRVSVTCVNSGTAALHLAAESILNAGDEVLVQSMTYVATFQAIKAAGAVPIPCDVYPETLTIDLDDAAKRITHRTRAIMPVHYASNPASLAQVYEFAQIRGLRVIEDAAHAFGCRYNGKLIGSFGDVVCFSFDGIKNITSGEGGVVVTKDPVVAERVRDGRLLGVRKDTERRYSGERSWEFDVERRGYRYHMSNIMAAIGRIQLGRFEKEFAPRRVELAKRYRARLKGIEGLSLFETDLSEVVPHIQPVRIMNGRRDELKIYLKERGVETGIHYKPNHLLKFCGGGETKLPVTDALYESVLSLPLHPELSMTDVDTVCDMIIEFISSSKGE